MGFLASAVLPPDAYLVSTNLGIIDIVILHTQMKKTHLLTTHQFLPASIRVSHRRRKRLLCLHPPTPRLAFLEPAFDRGSRTRHRPERIRRRAGANRRCMDLQGQRGKKGVSDGSLDQCGFVTYGHGGLCVVADLLRVEE